MNILIDGLIFSYDDFRLDLSLEIQSGEFMSVLGPSGCGKTSLLRLIAGFISPVRGRIFAGGKDITAVPTAARNIGMVFQDYALFPHLDVYGNIAYGLRTAKKTKQETDRQVDRMLDLTGLPGYKKRKIHELSGGEKQRVALARALAPEPGIMLFDEPLSALDVKLRKQLRREIKNIQHEAGFTALYVTHDQEEAMSISDRIALMKDGKILQCGSPEEVYKNPADLFTADFIGTMNVCESDRGTVMFRPESCVIEPGQPAAPHPQRFFINLTVKNTDYIGAYYICEGITEKGNIIIFNSDKRINKEEQILISVDFSETISIP